MARTTRTVAGDEAGVGEAANALRRGDLVVFPTETVYGVGANAQDARAVARIFAAKGRPPDNPLIVHAPDATAARRLTRAWPPQAEALARAFWPGPLTLVLPRAPDVPDLVTAGLDTVAIRVPDHPVARAILQAAGVCAAAPSANRSGRPSPTRVADARDDLGDAVTVYVDGGPTRVGLESTVVSLVHATPTILRPGGLSREAIERVIGPVDHAGEEAHDASAPATSPGTKYRHYAPANARVHLGEPSRDGLETRARQLRAQGRRVAVVASAEHAPPGADVRVPGARDDAQAWAQSLFALLRDLDAQGYDDILVEPIPEQGLGAAVMNRLRKAAQPRP